MEGNCEVLDYDGVFFRDFFWYFNLFFYVCFCLGWGCYGKVVMVDVIVGGIYGFCFYLEGWFVFCGNVNDWVYMEFLYNNY